MGKAYIYTCTMHTPKGPPVLCRPSNCTCASRPLRQEPDHLLLPYLVISYPILSSARLNTHPPLGRYHVNSLLCFYLSTWFFHTHLRLKATCVKKNKCKAEFAETGFCKIKAPSPPNSMLIFRKDCWVGRCLEGRSSGRRSGLIARGLFFCRTRYQKSL